MKTYHVEILEPVEIVAEGVRAKSGRDAVERVLKSAGFKDLRYRWKQNPAVEYPAGKRPAALVYREGDNGVFIHTIAWTE